MIDLIKGLRCSEELEQRYPFLFEKNGLAISAIPLGWVKIVENLLENIARRQFYLETNLSEKETYTPIKIVQIKKKFGYLTIYYDGGNDEIIRSLIFGAEDQADKTCEFCGTIENNVSKQKLFFFPCTICDKCLIEKKQENEPNK